MPIEKEIDDAAGDDADVEEESAASSIMTGTKMDRRKKGNRVQWFRAEADMQRWQEQQEQKLAELLRTNCSFFKMDQAWRALASSDLPAGRQAFARQKAAMYRKRAERKI
ncbi:hypothetical protein B0H13DRAFT_1900607 [Mycena leptocephala]|nr:hypothetical protein B0H13DRAFT_1900607 [Mycena leptocephala]